MQESGWNNSVVSSAGARGIMQVMPATGEWVGQYLLNRSLDLGDPADNVAAGMAYLDYLYGRFDGDIERTLASYYEGPRRVEENGVSEGGRRYAANVLALAERYG
jgi:soluble lytic murein transglycosylase